MNHSRFPCLGRRIRSALRIAALGALSTAQAQAQYLGAAPNFRGYNGPNLYAPDYYRAYNITPPHVLVANPTPFLGGSPSANPGYYTGTPYDYRGYNGVFGYNYPAYYNNYGTNGPWPSVYTTMLVAPAPAITRAPAARPRVTRAPEYINAGAQPRAAATTPRRVFRGPRRAG
jgi:hypothetical protein